MFVLLAQNLNLRFWNFFNKDPGHWIPACVGVGISITGTITDRESHAHSSFVDIVTVALDMADAMNILCVSLPQVHNTINW